MNNTKYFNFPIYFLKDFMINPIEEALSPILYYALYEHSQNLEEGSDIDKLNSSAKYFNVTMGDAKYVHKKGEKLNKDEIIGYPKVGINTKLIGTIETTIKVSLKKFPFWPF